MATAAASTAAPFHSLPDITTRRNPAVSPLFCLAPRSPSLSAAATKTTAAPASAPHKLHLSTPTLPKRHFSFNPPATTTSSSSDGDEAFRLLPSLSPKQITLLLKSQRDWKLTLSLFKRLRSDKDSYVPNPIHYNVVLRTLGRAKEWDELRLCWIDMAKDGVFPTNNTYSTLIDVYAKAGLQKEALLWVNHMVSRGLSPDEVTMGTVLRVLKEGGEFDRAERFFKGWCSGTVELGALDMGGDESSLEPLGPKHFILTELFKSGGRPPGGRKISSPEVGKGPRKPKLATTYNALIDLYGKAGRLKDASKMFAEMLRSGVALDTTTFNTMIHICGTHGNISEAEALLTKMDERRVPPDTTTFNIFMSLYASAGNVECVLKYYLKIRDFRLRPDVVTYRIVLQVLCGRNMVCEAEGVIEELEKMRVPVDEQSLPLVLKMYVDSGMLEEGMLFLEKHCFGRVISTGIYAAILDTFAEKGFSAEAEHVFFGRRHPRCKKDVIEYNVMIKAYGKAKLYDCALSLFDNMAACGTWPDECTYNSLIQMLALGDMPEKARGFLTKMQLAGFKPRCETLSAIISSCTRASMLPVIEDIYDEMKKSGIEPNQIVYGSLINAYAEAGELEKALHCFKTIDETKTPVNQAILTALIKAYSKVGRWKEAQELYANMKDLKDGPDIIASNSMLGLYAGLSMVSEAKIIFDDLRKKGKADGISYSTVMHLYKSMGMLDEAIEVAQEIQQTTSLIDCASFTNVMASYAAQGQLVQCGELLHQMQMRKILPDMATFKVMLTVLKKGGLPLEAVSQLEASFTDGKPYARQAIITSVFSTVGLTVFALESCETFVETKMVLDLSAYNAAIYAYGSAGNIDNALNLLMRMQDDGLKPDIVTYISLATCYGKAGLVEGVKRIYSKLKYGEIEPNESLFKAVMNAYRDSGRSDLADLVDQEMRFSLHGKVATDSDIENQPE